MYNRYQGNTGRVLRVSDEPVSPAVGQAALPGRGGAVSVGFGRAAAGADNTASRPLPGPPPGSIRPPGPLSGLSGELGRLLGRLSPMKLETDDLLLMMVLYLMYRESHDEELLFIMAAMFLL